MTRHRNLSSRFGEEKVTKLVTMSMEKVTKSKTMTPDLDTLTPDLDTLTPT